MRLTVSAAVVVGLLSLGGCSVSPTGLVAVSVVDGRMTFAIVGCTGDVDNTRFVLTGPPPAKGKAQVLGEWHRTEATSRRATFDPARPADGWIVDQPLGDLALLSENLRAFATPTDDSNRGTDQVSFTREELTSLTPGSWIYTTYESDDDSDEVRSVNKMARSLDELDAAAKRYSCLG